MNLEFTQLRDLIELATSKDIYDWASLLIPNTITMFTVWISYFYFNKQAKQVMLERVVEKEVEKLYEATDSFFKYSDAVSLFFSMSFKEIERIIEDKEMEATFQDKLNKSSDTVYSLFTEIHKASFLIRALGQTNVSQLIDNYREDTIKYRKEIYKVMANYNNDKNKQLLKEFYSNHVNKKHDLESLKILCLDEIAKCKSKIKGIQV